MKQESLAILLANRTPERYGLMVRVVEILELVEPNYLSGILTLISTNEVELTLANKIENEFINLLDTNLERMSLSVDALSYIKNLERVVEIAELLLVHIENYEDAEGMLFRTVEEDDAGTVVASLCNFIYGRDATEYDEILLRAEPRLLNVIKDVLKARVAREDLDENSLSPVQIKKLRRFIDLWPKSPISKEFLNGGYLRTTADLIQVVDVNEDNVVPEEYLAMLAKVIVGLIIHSGDDSDDNLESLIGTLLPTERQRDVLSLHALVGQYLDEVNDDQV